MKRKWIYAITFTLIFSLLAACSSHNNKDDSSAGNDSMATEDIGQSASSDMDSDKREMAKKGDSSGENKSADKAENTKNTNEQAAANIDAGQMVIYNADMTISVKQFQQARDKVQSLVAKTDGYIVQSSITDMEDSKKSGSITARIPQSKFNSFLDSLGRIAEDIKERNVEGEDVTKQYVDLKSRLKAKTEVKKRLDTFLKQAKNTKDLLDISQNLANIQEEIEQIKGQMKYLENHSALATVTVTMIEKNVEIGGLKEHGDLNTWAKTKKAFVNSTNAILTFFSGLLIFLIGYSPILIPLIVIAVVVYLIYRRRKRREN